MGFIPEDGSDNVYIKVYNKHNNYIIKVNFNLEKIEYRIDSVKEELGIKWGDSTTCNLENSENFVVLECINRLLEKGYEPKHITLEKKYPLGRELKGKLDIFVVDRAKKPYLMIECKTWGNEFDKETKKMIKDGGQLISYFAVERATKYLCLYTSRLNNSELEYKNNIIPIDESWKDLSNANEIHDHWNKNFNDNGIFENWVNAYNVEVKALIQCRLKPITKDDSGKIFNQFAEILRHNVVSDKPNAFNKILNLFICKIIDEDKNENEQVDFQWLENDDDISLQTRLNDLYKKGMQRFLDIDVTDYSENDIKNSLATITDNNAKKEIESMFTKLRLQKNPEFAFIEVYDDESFRLNARVVKEVVELLQPYKFRYGHKQQFLGDFFELLLNTSIKQEAGQYFTPVPITRYIVNSLPIKEFIEKKLISNDSDVLPAVIDFACGTGHFLTEYMDRVQKIIEKEIDFKSAKPSTKNKLSYWSNQGKFEWANEYVYGIDADYRLVKSSKVSSFLNGDGEANIIRANGLDNFQKSKEYKGRLKKVASDNEKDNSQFDILIANPPYSVNSFKSTIKYGEESFDLFNKLTDNSSEIECLFIERMKQLLKIGGYAGIILPSSILSNSGIYSASREIILKYFYIKGITEFGPNTFMATGTNTITLFLERRQNSDWKIIKTAIDSFFDKPKDVTVLGIEKVFSKYIKFNYEEIHFEDYISLINKKPNDTIYKSQMFIDYKNSFEKSSEYKKLIASSDFKLMSAEEREIYIFSQLILYIINIEKEKLLYFILTSEQKTTVVKVGEKQNEKDFIGYEFSTRRGHEGIKMLPTGTKLYDENNLQSREKANTYNYYSYLNKEMDIDESLSNNISIFNTSELINFQSPLFDKIISYKKKLSTEIVSKWDRIELSKLNLKIESGSRPKGGVAYIKDGVFSVGGEHINVNGKLNMFPEKYVPEEFYNNAKQGKIQPNDILICKDGALTGKICLVPSILPNEKMIVNEHVFILRSNNIITQKYLFYLLSSNEGQSLLKNNITGQAQGGLSWTNLNSIKVPFPPLEIQRKIVEEMDKVSDLENLNIEKIKNLEDFNKNLFKHNDYDINCKFSDIATLEYGSALSKYQRIKGEYLVVGSNGIDGSHNKYIVKAPCIIIGRKGSAGKINYYEKNCFPIDTTFYVSFNKEINCKYFYYYLQTLNLEDLAKGKGMGVPGLNRNDVHNLNIKIHSPQKQRKLISEIEKNELYIKKLEEEIKQYNIKKITILKNYL